jgi:predicted transglutaminase-like cysteine proteinase
MTQLDRSPMIRHWRLPLLGGMAAVASWSSPLLAAEISDIEDEAEVCAQTSLAEAGQIAPAAAPLVSKSAAILGGEPSSLERIRMAQLGVAMPVAAAPIAMPATAFEPSSAQPVSVTANIADCRSVSVPVAVTEIQPIADDSMILGSLRLSIRTTPFDQKWGRVSQAGSVRGLKRWVGRTGASTAADPRAKVAAINSWVNGRIAYADDSVLYRQNDFWASSRETLRRGKGDCEDYAILKMDLLAAMGIDRDKMILVVARDLVRNADHALLVVQLDGGSVVLDNSTDFLLDGRLANDYRPIMSFASNGKWLHGYAVAAAQPQTQPASPLPEPAVTVAALSVPLVPVTELLGTALASN